MQLTTATAFLAVAASLASAQSVPASAPGCVKYCLRIARQQAPSACTWAGWCNLSGFQDSVSTCYNNICGPANQQVGAQVYQQICSSAGSNTVCPSSGTASLTSAVSSASSSAASVTSSIASETSSAASSISESLSSVASSASASASASASSVSASVTSAASSISASVSSATAPVSSAISSLLSSASNAASSAASAGASATSAAPNAGVAVGLPTHGQIASIGALLLGAVAGALVL
ncbi:hypothetical protein FRC12_014901 [Ceratobasidium sp. 428]|nr:hypothetical protein FRC12_014901 [Ceratobasidium sp. 428]